MRRVWMERLISALLVVSGFIETLPNAIRLVQPQHLHSPFLTCNINLETEQWKPLPESTQDCKCAVCGETLQSLGAYNCVKCRYYAHIRCATSDPRRFEPVLIRDAKLADLLHLPMADERSSIVRYMLENTSAGEYEAADGHQLPVIFHHEDDDDDNDDDSEEEEEAGNPKYGHDRRLHKHPLIFHDEDNSGDGDDDGTEHSSSRVCNACVELISAPFYSCSQCRDFLLHSSCVNLPTKIQHPFHPEHTLSLFTKAPKKSYQVGFYCSGCGLLCTGYAYSCKTCRHCTMDVLCALMSASITHASHGKTHILYMSSRYSQGRCSCCNHFLQGKMFYDCSNCRHLKLHACCALLPTTISHKYDVHPLNLTTSTKIITTDDDDDSHERQQICEVCEKDINEICWHYSCNDCDQWFHINCIPFLDYLSRIKFGDTVDFKFHDCPLTLVREHTLFGYICVDCKRKFRYVDYAKYCAYECSKCCYRIHEICAMTKFLHPHFS